MLLEGLMLKNQLLQRPIHLLPSCPLRMADLIWIIDSSGKLTTGAPEDMVRNGIISEAFDSDHYQFDKSGFLNEGK